MADEATWRLTPERRARLRRSVDVSALERLLSRLPPKERPLMLLGFCRDPTAGETVEVLRAFGISDPELEELRQLAEHVPIPPDLAHPENDPDPNWTARLWQLTLRVPPPSDRELRALWEAVEPRPGAP